MCLQHSPNSSIFGCIENISILYPGSKRIYSIDRIYLVNGSSFYIQSAPHNSATSKTGHFDPIKRSRLYINIIYYSVVQVSAFGKTDIHEY